MKYRLLEFLKAPGTDEGFSVEVYNSRQLQRDIVIDRVKCSAWCHKEGKPTNQVTVTDCRNCYNLEITEGKLTAGAIQYPIVAGVPRILPRELLRETLQTHHADFLVRHGADFDTSLGIDYAVETGKKRTARAFGYQWRTFLDNYDYFKEIMLSFTRPFLDEADYAGKVMLEIGCGSGRPAVTACQMGAEVIGMDLSVAVESASHQAESVPMLHVVQADAYAPPFRQKFDVVYSVGVLQHIPSPQKALIGIRSTVSADARLVLWVYGKRELWYQPIEWLRSITTRMPVKLLHVFSYILAIFSEIFLLIPYRLLSKFNLSRQLAGKIPGRIYARFPFRENVLGWFDRLVAPVTYYFEQDGIRKLLEETGFTNIEIHARTEASASWVIQAAASTDD